ncbi:MAG: DUF1003 domain-containing protein [Acidobacteria bacterium]|jgi:uncharacterized membrane protein|nr:DUF1003 domain-containing protein [Acidobacteriota bacterium]
MDTNKLIAQIQKLDDRERAVVAALLSQNTIARDVDREYTGQLTFGERVADQVASFGGSWKFLGLFLGSMGIWIAINVVEMVPFDPYPFILLNLVLSCVAAIQAPVIMMSQNRQSSRDRLDARHDYEINLKAEMEVMGLHVKVDELRDRQWAALVDLQDRQLKLLERIEAKLGKEGL